MSRQTSIPDEIPSQLPAKKVESNRRVVDQTIKALYSDPPHVPSQRTLAPSQVGLPNSQSKAPAKPKLVAQTPPTSLQARSSSKPGHSALPLLDRSPPPMQITEVSVVAVMRLAGCLKHLEAVMGLWDEAEKACDCEMPFAFPWFHVRTASKSFFLASGRGYMHEIQEAVIDVKGVLDFVHDLADDGLGTEEAGYVENRATKILENLAKCRAEQKGLRQKPKVADGEKKGKQKLTEKDHSGKLVVKEVEMEKKVETMKGKENMKARLSDEEEQKMWASFLEAVRAGLRSGSEKKENGEILSMKKILLDDVKSHSRSCDRARGRTDGRDMAS